MTSDSVPGQAAELVTITVRLKIAGHDVETQFTVSNAPMQPRQLLPLVQWVTDAVVAVASEESRRRGLSISCKPGCAACCRQMVPITYSEAQQLRDLVAAMPIERQREIRRRFAAAVEHFRSVGLLEQFSHVNRLESGAKHRLGIRYLAEGVACPFLEQENCSIYAQRPVGCREYLVTSPPANCAAESNALVDMVPLPVRVGNAVVDLDKDVLKADYYPWFPLILALDDAVCQPRETIARTGPELAAAFFRHLTGKELPPAESETAGIRPDPT